MANYEAWNSAIVNYFTAGASHGSHIFLSLDDEAVYDVADKFLDEKIDNPMDDYIAAVKDYCIQNSFEKIDIGALLKERGGIPGGVGFLGVMVLAAHRMQDEEGIDETNYFLRLREIIKLSPIRHRPDGMPSGSEEVLWIKWNNYLKHSGFEPTAEKGLGPHIFVQYPLSQAILRESDKQFLRQRFHESNVALQMDRSQLGFWLSRQQINRKHLKEGLHHVDPAHVWEFYLAAYRVYNEGNWSDNNPYRSRSSQKIRNIESGLYRVESLFGDIQYHIFPKQPDRSRSIQLFISNDDRNTPEPLKPLKEGYFRPLWSQNPFVDEPLRLQITGDPNIQYLTFPKRDFWILSTEINNPQSALATWKPYHELGEKLLILCKNGIFCTEMLNLRKGKLIDWTKQVQCEGWIEYYNCMVLSYDFGDFIATPECRALVDSLAPQSPASISLSGGLRDVNQNAWLEGFPPSLKIYGFEKHFEVTITNSAQLSVFYDELSQQEDIDLPKDLNPDVYQIEAKWNGRRAAARIFRIITWDDIQGNSNAEEIVNSQHISTGGLLLRGPIILNQNDRAGGVQNA